MASSAISGRHLSKFEKTAENTVTDGFGSNFFGRGVLPAPPVGRLLVELFSWLKKRFRPFVRPGYDDKYRSRNLLFRQATNSTEGKRAETPHHSADILMCVIIGDLAPNLGRIIRRFRAIPVLRTLMQYSF